MMEVMGEGPSHLSASFAVGQSVTEFFELSQTLSPTEYVGAGLQCWL